MIVPLEKGEKLYFTLEIKGSFMPPCKIGTIRKGWKSEKHGSNTHNDTKEGKGRWPQSYSALHERAASNNVPTDPPRER